MSRDSVESCNPTARYQYIIECVKKAGFDNVDSMVSGYYTLTFDKNSVADRAQTASRGKHLRNVLSSLHENSRDWTTWEARGFRDQIVEAAEGIYGAEFSRLAQRVEKKKSRNKRSASATSVEDKTPVSTSSPYEDDHSMWREGDSIAVLNDDPMIETLSHETLSDLNRLYQNEVRYQPPVHQILSLSKTQIIDWLVRVSVTRCLGLVDRVRRWFCSAGGGGGCYGSIASVLYTNKFQDRSEEAVGSNVRLIGRSSRRIH